MSDLHAKARQMHFRVNLLTWTALRHFLPARLARELSSAMVERLSGGEITLDRLFSSSMSSTPEWLASWSLKPLQTQTSLERFLQSNIRSLAWNHDGMTHVPEGEQHDPDRLSPRAIEYAVRIATADLKVPRPNLNGWRISGDASYEIFLDTIAKASTIFESSTPEEFAEEITRDLEQIQSPLSLLIMKHMGDLCADQDDWHKASRLYEVVASSLGREMDGTWGALLSPFRGTVALSRLSAFKVLEGAAAALSFAKETVQNCLPEDEEFLLANGSFDMHVVAMQTEGMLSTPDLRAAILSPPLLHTSHDHSSALRDWRKADYQDAHREFWAVLRRQVALGLFTESRATKAFYAASIFDSLRVDLKRNRQPDYFRMGLALIIESEDTNVASTVEWTDEIVAMYVDRSAVKFAISHSSTYEGAHIARHLVLVELLCAWIALSALDNIELSEAMLKQVVASAVEGPISFYSNENLGGRSFEILKDLAERRPELRYLVAAEVSSAVALRIGSQSFWKGRDTALELACGYAEVLSTEQLTAVVEPTLEILVNSETGVVGPLVDTALSLLVTPAVKRLSKADAQIGRRVIDAIVRFTVGRQDNPSRALFLLHEFDDELFRNSDIARQLTTTVQQVRLHALQSNSTGAIGSIQALLWTPVISGVQGVKDALQGLSRIITPVNGSYTSLSLANAYASFMHLANNHEILAGQLSIGVDEMEAWLTAFIPLIAALWLTAIDHPAIFSPFSMPAATLPNPTIVHNWAFASIVFAESLGKGEEIEAALNRAMIQPVLRDPISLARATRSTRTDSGDAISPESIRTESRDGFYSALGRRLVLLQRMDDPDLEYRLCDALLYQCLRQGPRTMDAAVIMFASRIRIRVSETKKLDYVSRMGTDRTLRLALIPLLELIESAD